MTLTLQRFVRRIVDGTLRIMFLRGQSIECPDVAYWSAHITASTEAKTDLGIGWWSPDSTVLGDFGADEYSVVLSIRARKQLQAIRLGDEVSQVEFARMLGISRSHLCDIEHARKSVSLARAMKFAKVLGYPADQFVRLALQSMVDEVGLNMQVKVEAA